MMLYMYISKKVENHLAASCKLHGSPQRLHHHALETFCNATNLITSKLKSFKKKVDNSINDLNTDCYRYLMFMFIGQGRNNTNQCKETITPK